MNIILTTIEEYFGRKIEDSKTFFRELERHPHDLILLSFHLEDKLKFRFPDEGKKESFSDCRTVGQLCRLLEPILRKKGVEPIQPEKPKVQGQGGEGMKRKQKGSLREKVYRRDTRTYARDLIRKLFAESLKKQGLLEK